MFGRGKLNGEHDMNLSSSSSYSHFNSSSLDVDRSISSLTWHESESLSREHVEDALEKSKDGGATLVLMKLRLEDIGEDGAEALASIGTENDDETSRIERCVARCRVYLNTSSTPRPESRSRITA